MLHRELRGKECRSCRNKGDDVCGKDNGASKNSNTALILAAADGHLEVVKLLREAKANVNAADKTSGITSLWQASQDRDRGGLCQA